MLNDFLTGLFLVENHYYSMKWFLTILPYVGVSDYNYEEETSDPGDFNYSIDQLALAFSTR